MALIAEEITNMKKYILPMLASFCLALSSFANAIDNPKVIFKTDLGSFVVELYPKQAPITVQNFLTYVDTKFYDGTIFHRVVPGFVAQTGGMTFDFNEKETNAPIKNESFNKLGNDYKTLAMARLNDPDSATSQFYINLKANPALNATETKPGYTVFGKVIEGMEVIEKIAQEPRGMFKAHPEAPNYAVRILTAERLAASGAADTSVTPQSTRIKDALVTP
jgi:peptidyl-prolyl cis-trans isomerase A (cyclophilin A)